MRTSAISTSKASTMPGSATFGLFTRSPASHALNLLASIAETGLGCPKSTSIRGSLTDYRHPTPLCYNQVRPTDYRRLDEAVNSLVFHGKEGLWTIACERRFSHESLERLPYVISDALLNSVVFIFARDLKRCRTSRCHGYSICKL